MTRIQIGDTAARQIEWNVASATITGTVQWEGQAARAIVGAIAFRETLNNVHFYDWAYDAADRPSVASAGVVTLTDGTTTVSLAVEFVAVAQNMLQVRKLLEADQILETADGVTVLRTYERGTSTAVIPAKTPKQPDGNDLTDPTTQRLAGYRE